MPNVDFYILTEPSVEAAYNFICRLADKAYQQKHQIYIYANSPAEAKSLDELLWIFRDDAFIPHCIEGEITDPVPPILIGSQTTPMQTHGILLNLTPEIPTFIDGFQRVIELVANEPNAKDRGRKKFRDYRDKKYEITTHDLTKTA